MEIFGPAYSEQKLTKKQRKKRNKFLKEVNKYGELTKCSYCNSLVHNLANHINESHQVEAYFTGMKNVKVRNKICD